MQLNDKINRQDSKESFYAGVLFLIWPFLATISAFRNYKKPWAKNVFWAFCAFYGFTFAIGAESQTSDIVRYVARLKFLQDQNLSPIEGIEYFMNTGDIDIFNFFITFVLSFFTESQAVLTMIYGIIFGFFYSRNIWYVLDYLEGKLLFITIILLSCFFLINPIWNINGFRMWTATHVFIYGLLPFLFEGKKKGLWISSLSILIHFSFVVPIIILFMYLILGNRLGLYFGFFLLTFFLSELDISAFNKLIENYAPEIVQERTSSYRAEGMVEQFRESKNEPRSLNWYAIWYKKALNWSVMGFLVVLFFKARTFFDQNEGWLNLFSYTLLIYSAGNILSSIPSGSRYLVIANLCAVALITLYIQNQKSEKMMKRVTFFATPALLLFIIVSIRSSLLSFSATTILGNPIIAIFTNEFISLNDVLKSLI